MTLSLYASVLAEDRLAGKNYAKPLYIDVYGLGYNVPHVLNSLLRGSYSCIVGDVERAVCKQKNIAIHFAANGAVHVSQTGR